MSGDDFKVSGGYADVYPNIRFRGLVQPAIWLCDYVAPGEPVIVGEIGKKDAPGELVVLGRVGQAGPTEGSVTAAPAGSDTITVTANTVPYTVTFLASYTPTVGDRVRLLWQGGAGTALGTVGVTPAPVIAKPTTVAPPPPASSGVLPVPAIDSATYSPGYGWNSSYRQNAYQGDASPWGGPTQNFGAWFYGDVASQLNGATITAATFRVPARTSGGYSSSGSTIHLYLHTNPTRPGGDVNRVAGPTDFPIPAGYLGGDEVPLPSGWFAGLVAGGGISIGGGPYTGFVGCRGDKSDPASGQLKFTWNR